MAIAAPISAYAQNTPRQSENDKNADNKVIITGQRKDVVNKIDRRIYNIKDDPASKTGMALDVLDKIPSVQVNANGRVSLRGDPWVTILIDGKAPTNGQQALQSMSGNDIERVEVMTNPSAQYAPDGTSGIINIITKKHLPLGFSGNINIRGNDFGQRNGSAQLNFKYDRLTIKTIINSSHEPLPSDGGKIYISPFVAQSSFKSDGQIDSSRFDMTTDYKINDNNSLTLKAIGFNSVRKTNNKNNYTSDITNYDGKITSRDDYQGHSIEGIYNFNNENNGTSFSIDATHDVYDPHNYSQTINNYADGDISNYGLSSKSHIVYNDLKSDFERNFSDNNNLSMGFEYFNVKSNQDSSYFDIGGITGPYGGTYFHEFNGKQAQISFYTTYQQNIGKWTILPGLRIENEEIKAASGGLSTDHNKTSLYPSLHLSHDLGANSKLKLSYSRRVDRPEIYEYDPGIIGATATTRQTGNPNLKPSDTDSFEINYNYSKDKFNYETTVYYRKTYDYKSDYSYVDTDGIIVTRPENNGQLASGGLEFNLKTPLDKIIKGFNYSTNLNLYYRQVPQYSGGVKDFYGLSGNSLFEYQRPNRANDLKGDLYQLKVIYRGRIYDSQGYSAGYYRTDFTYQHNVSKNISLVASIINFTDQNRLKTVVKRDNLYYISNGLNYQSFVKSVQLGLSYKFSK
ncbi:TonB-dependent receptor [Pseudaquidulcibacter saccharophilus]|uniref:TonB-dependent receptor n=1 Tax=Pseudaquidulcibacter saccharophilus TaxID=2831900 RepID=UPI001EFF0876|nr:TonB-dependent receptor [Pseudaquidulcibacter saccharophilus]